MLTKLTALKNHGGFIRYFKNTSWMMGEQFLRIIAGLFVGIWVAINRLTVEANTHAFVLTPKSKHVLDAKK